MPQRGVLEVAMKVLWLCNVVLPVAARQLGMEVSNKEGWVSGMAQELLERRQENDIALILAFPVPKAMVPEGEEIFCREIQVEMPPGEERESGQEGAGQAEADSGQKNAAERKASSGKVSLACCGFPEDVRCPEKYDGSLEPALKKIVDIVRPDIVHCFGTEYPHTLAMCRVFPRKDRILVGLQGLCVLYAQAYYADLPERVIRSVTLRDFLRKDNLRQQRQKFVLRGEMEREAIGMAGNVTGRTEWDKSYALEWNPKARYHAMNETLRREFYGPVWDRDRCIPHSIFLSRTPERPALYAAGPAEDSGEISGREGIRGGEQPGGIQDPETEAEDFRIREIPEEPGERAGIRRACGFFGKIDRGADAGQISGKQSLRVLLCPGEFP